MKRFQSGALVFAGMLGVATASWAQQRLDQGKVEYDAHCAVCHGVSGKGNGELRKFLTKSPSDLTTMTRRNGGAFPNQLAWELIDGRSTTEVGPHGSREMPVWGQRYRIEALAQAGTATEPEWYVRNRIVSLLDYLSRIQDK